MGDSKRREAFPQLLDLIPDEKEWKTREEEAPGRSRNIGFGDEEDKKLELKLGLPGFIEEMTAVSRDEGMQHESLALSLGNYPKSSKSTTPTHTMKTGTKRVFIDTVEAIKEGSNEQRQEGCDIAGCGNKLALEEKIATASERNNGCTPTPLNAPPASMCKSGNRAPAHGRGLRGASASVVGWPPIQSFRRNFATSSSSKQSPELQNGDASMKAKLTCKTNPLVKINMDGIPIGRKIDLTAYDSYEKLSLVVRELFQGFLEAQKEVPAESSQQRDNEKIFSQLLDGSGEYTLVYEDNEGNRMPVGDMPWNVFVSTAKRLRVLRSSELPMA